MLEIKSLVEKMVKSIVDNPEGVHIEEEDSGRGLFYEISVAKEDVGKLIGKGGRIAAAIRTISKASGAKHGVRVSTNVMKEPYEPNG
jgi:predicted RNA-binding protein YlqC (UPF0109 family)